VTDRGDNPPGYPFEPALEISVPETARRHKAGEDGFILIDIREPDELEVASIDGALHIPMATLADELARRGVDRDATLALLCRTGNRTRTAATRLQSLGYENARSVAGGIHWWSDRLDPTLTKY